MTEELKTLRDEALAALRDVAKSGSNDNRIAAAELLLRYVHVFADLDEKDKA